MSSFPGHDFSACMNEMGPAAAVGVQPTGFEEVDLLQTPHPVTFRSHNPPARDCVAVSLRYGESTPGTRLKS